MSRRQIESRESGNKMFARKPQTVQDAVRVRVIHRKSTKCHDYRVTRGNTCRVAE